MLSGNLGGARSEVVIDSRQVWYIFLLSRVRIYYIEYIE